MTAIKYEVHKLKNSQGTGEDRAYIQVRNTGAKTVNELAEMIQEACSVTKADVLAVMTELSHFAVKELSYGSRFYLPEIGYLSLKVGNVPPSKKPDGKITGKDIYLKNIKFQPEDKFLNAVRKGMTFEKSNFSTLSAQYNESELWQKVEAYLSENRFINCHNMSTQFGLSRYMARKWLKSFMDAGKLVRAGSDHQPLYFLPK